MAINNESKHKSLQTSHNQTGSDTSNKGQDETRALFEQFFESSPDGVLVVDSQGLITRVNGQTEEMFGYSRSELQGQPIEVLVPNHLRKAHEKDRNHYQTEPHMRAMGAGLELFAMRKDGSEFPVEIMLSPIESAEGTMVLSVVRDITRRKQAENALRTSEEQLQNILDNSTAIIFVKNLEGRYIRVNRRFENLYGVEGRLAVGKTDFDLFPRELAETLRTNDQKVLEAEAPLEFEEIKSHGGIDRTYISIKFPLHDPSGQPYAVAGISTDITERKKAEEALLFEISKVLLSNLDVRGLFTAISATLQRIMPHEFATLALYWPESKDLRLL